VLRRGRPGQENSNQRDVHDTPQLVITFRFALRPSASIGSLAQSRVFEMKRAMVASSLVIDR